MTISIIPNLENDYTAFPQHQNHHSQYCTISWRRGKLLVKSGGKFTQPYLPALDDPNKLVRCLQHSPINLVYIDPKIGAYWLKYWANACEKANKSIFLHLPSSHKRRKPSNKLLAGSLKLIDWLLALILLLLFSPVMLVLMLITQIYTPSSLFSYQWCVGKRGRLFRLMKFNTNSQENPQPLVDWISKFGLDNLPQLWNVIQGEMSLLGFRYWYLEEVVQFSLGTGEEIDKFKYSVVSELDQQESVLRELRELKVWK